MLEIGLFHNGASSLPVITRVMSAIRDPSGVLILQDHQERLRHRRLTGRGGA